ncbi:acid protease [Lyophyllum atratum]|nr:acid protease [Lyophyllum atratum]
MPIPGLHTASMKRLSPVFLGLVLFAATQVLGQIPQTIHLESRIAPSGASLKRRALAPSNIPLADFFKGTDLQWFGNISVGTPPQDITVVFDTGSSSLEFASTLCGQACASQKQFDSSKSSTFVDGGRTSSITFSTGVGVDPVVGSNYKLTLRSASDTVSVGGLKATAVSLFLITNQTPAFNIDPFSGIQGMSATAQGFFASLISQGLPSLFSLFLTPNAVGNAELTIGGIDNTKFKGNPTFASLPAGSSSTWRLLSPRLSVNGKTTSLLNTQRSVIFDSGTSNVLFSTATTEAIYSLISPDIKPNAAEPGTYGIACNRISSLPAVIDIAFTSQAGTPFNLTIPSSELSVGPFANDPSLCQTLINAFDGLDLVGGSVLKHYYSIWDVGGRRLGFAPV